MTLATMADRALPLAKRVNAAYLVGIRVADGDENGRDARAALDALRADVAAADRLARTTDDFEASCLDITIRRIVPREHDEEGEWRAALEAYRARMAQGVARG